MSWASLVYGDVPTGLASTAKRPVHKQPLVRLLFVFLLSVTLLQYIYRTAFVEQSGRFSAQRLPCSRLPGANETLVVMRTGATEFQHKFPVHLSTTLRCFPNYMIVADFEETYRGERVFNALDSVSSEIKESHEDFSLYRKLKAGGRAALNTTELSGPNSRETGSTGKTDNAGWKLDKWKFLPMMNLTMQEHPNMKWYLFVEPDTFVFWSTLLQYLNELDHTKPYYLGAPSWIGKVVFAHGGAGFAVSQEAMRRVTQHFNRRKQYWEEYTDRQWAGDCVLGKAFQRAGAPLTSAWPIFQGADIGAVPYARVDGKRRVWCQSTVSYHHLNRDTIDDMWNFEQQWLGSQDKDSQSYLRHNDVFAQYVLPRMQNPKDHWDNECEDDQGTFKDIESCESKCLTMFDCLQYSFNNATKVCKTSSVPKLGQAWPTTQSGWVVKRVEDFAAAMPSCGNYRSWVT